MNITLCSAFRNSTPYLGRYLSQVWQLFLCLSKRGDSLRLVWGEGDSTDGTSEYLADVVHDLAGPLFSINATLVDCTHGGPEYGSVVDAQRFKQLAHVGRCIWAAVPDGTDAVLYCESDLIWRADTMLKLIDRLQEYPAVSPMILLEREPWPENSWYDTFCFRRDGVHFKHQPPYHECYNAEQPFRVDSAGSCMIIDAKLARCLVWDERIFPGICQQITAFAGAVWVDPSLSVVHR